MKRKFELISLPALDLEECFMCLETDADLDRWIKLGSHTLHLPCIVQMLIRTLNPKHPLTRQALTQQEIDYIEKRAARCNIHCPKRRDREWILLYEKKFDALQEFVQSFSEEEVKHLDLDSKIAHMRLETQDFQDISCYPEKYGLHLSVPSGHSMPSGEGKRTLAERELSSRFTRFERDLLQNLSMHIESPLSAPIFHQIVFIVPRGREALSRREARAILELILQ